MDELINLVILLDNLDCYTHDNVCFSGLSACERKSFIFLRKELPVRLANIMKEIHLLPENLLKMPSVGIVNNLYATSFDEIIDFEKAEVNETTLDKWVSIILSIVLVILWTVSIRQIE